MRTTFLLLALMIVALGAALLPSPGPAAATGGTVNVNFGIQCDGQVAPDCAVDNEGLNPAGDPLEFTKDVATCSLTQPSAKVINATIDNGYPGYKCHFWTDIAHKEGGLTVSVTNTVNNANPSKIVVTQVPDGTFDSTQWSGGFSGFPKGDCKQAQLAEFETTYCDWEIEITKTAAQNTAYPFSISINIDCGSKCATAEVLSINGTVCTGPDTGVCPTTPPLPPPQPAILLVHGYRGSCSSMQLLEQYLESNGYAGRVECFNPQDNGYDATDGGVDSALRLAAYVRGFKERMGLGPGDKFDIVAHSFGGLVSRYYIEKMAGHLNVRSLTMLGTPNLGVYWRGLRWLGSGLQDRGLVDLAISSAFLDCLNYNVDCVTANFDASDSYRVVAGTSDSSILYPCCGAQGLALYRNDCLVRVDSAIGPNPPFAKNEVDARHTEGVPMNVLCPGNTAPGLLSSSSPAFPIVLSVLSLSASASAGAPLERLVTEAAGQGTPETVGANPLAKAADGVVVTAGTDSHAVQVDGSASRATFLLLYADDGSVPDLSLVLRRPDDSIVNSGDGGVTHVVLPAGDPAGVLGEQYIVDVPPSGEWTMTVGGVSTPAGGQPYSITVMLDSTVSLDTDAEPSGGLAGAPVTILATLLDGVNPVTGATVTATITRPDDSTVPLILNDDGVGGDEASDDGIYTGTYADTASCGLYGVVTVATGVAATGAFERTDQVFYESRVPGDGAGDRCLSDDDADGCLDTAEVQTDPGSEGFGGLRDPLYYFDFMDMWVNKQKDRRVNIIDIGAIVNRFGDTGNPGGDPLDPPQALAGYHVSADRSPPIGANLWNAGPPDGNINIIEIGLAVTQFGHDCN